MHGAAARRGIGDLDQSVHPVATADLRGLTNGPEVRQSVETIVDVRRSTFDVRRAARTALSLANAR